MKRIKSFTILELVIAMLISSIVLSISYYSMGELNKRFSGFIKRSNQLSEFRLFEKAIQRDASISSLITWNDDALFFKQQENLVSYAFGQQQIVRVCKGDRFIFEMGGEVQDRHYQDEDNVIIDDLKINIRVSNESLILRLDKQYTPVELLEAKSYINE